MSYDDTGAPDVDDISDHVPDGPADEFGGDEFGGDEFGGDEFGGDVGDLGAAGSLATPLEPSGWQPPPPTGVRGVDDAVEPLTELDELPTAEHVAYYETAHRRLQDALADLDGA